MSAQPKPYYTPAEYLAIERESETKNEYFQGEIFAMSGASRAYNLLVKNVLVSLDNRLSNSCNVFPSDMRVHVAANGLYTYPDVSVVCGEEQYLEDAYLDTLLNPVVLVEVLSKTTARDDRNSKFLLYKSIASLQHYVLVDCQRVNVALYSRGAGSSWLFEESQGVGAVLPLPTLGIEVPLAEIYRRLELPG